MRIRVSLSLVGLLCLAFLLPAMAADKPNPELKLKVGDLAPNFTLRDQAGKQVSLNEFRGKKSVVLAFYVFAFTGG